MTALLLLAAAGSAGLGTPLPLLAIGFVGLAYQLLRSPGTPTSVTQQVGEQIVATIFERKGSLRLRRRKG